MSLRIRLAASNRKVTISVAILQYLTVIGITTGHKVKQYDATCKRDQLSY